MADFVVDYALLQQVENSLNSLKREFEGINAVSHAADWGDGGIGSAMGDFASNWSYHRQQLMKSMDSMTKQVRETHVATNQWDAKNQQALTKKK